MKIKSKKLLIVCLTAVIMALGVFAVTPYTAKALEIEITEVTTWGELHTAVNSDKTYIKLMNNVTDIVPDDELPTKHRLVFNGGIDYVLDLNGYELKVLNHANEYFTGDFSLIDVVDGSNLEIKNGSIIFDNYFSKANHKEKGVIAVKDESTLTAIDVSMYNKYNGSVVYANASASVTLEGGEYSVQNGFALYLENMASLTLNGPYIHTVMGDSASTQSVKGYGALYSASEGELIINDAFFKSGVQITSSQIDAFSIATHEVTINGKVLDEDIFEGTNFEAKKQEKEYYWYNNTGYSLTKTDNGSFANPIRVISYEKKYPITVESGIAMINDIPVTEASYGQEVTIVAHNPEEGMEFVRWDTNALLDDKYSSSTTFIMGTEPVELSACYGKEAVKSVSVTVGDIILGQEVNKTQITLENGGMLQGVEWREEQSLLMGDYAVFKAGKSYTVTMLVYPPEDNKFGDTVTATVNGKSATVNGNSQYVYIEYTFEATPSAGFAIVYDIGASQLGVGGKIVLDTELMASQSAEFKTALEEGKVTYQWYREGEAIEGATNPDYSFIAEDVTCIFYVAVTANGKTNYGHNVTCSSDLYQVYLNASEIIAGERAPEIYVATPGVSIVSDSLYISEIFGDNSFGPALNAGNAILIPGKSYRMVGKLIEEQGVIVAYGANVYVNDLLMSEPIDGTFRFFYDFEVPEADYNVYYKANGAVGIGATLTVDIQKMYDESGTFKHAVDVQAQNPTYQTVFYQWYKNCEAIEGATNISYTVKTTDRDSYIHCKVTLVDGKYGIGEQQVITNEVTVINVEMPLPKDGEGRITSASSDQASKVQVMWWPKETGAEMQSGDTYVEGTVYEFYILLSPKESFVFASSEDRTVYVYGQKVTHLSGYGYMGEITAIHKHKYSDEVWAHDEVSHWKPCIIPGCPNPNEELENNVEHWGGGATCKTAGICGECGAEYYADHDFSVPDYQYVDDTKCANFCENCDVYADWSYHEGGVATCQQKAVCEFCHHEYGKLAECSGGNATCTQKAVCSTCGKEYGELVPHSYGSEWKSDESAHWNECECGDKSNVASHQDENGDSKCDVCEYQTSAEPINPDSSNPENSEKPDSSEKIEAPKKGLSGGAIAGIVVGSVVVLGGGGFAIFWFVIRKKSFADLIAVLKKK